MVGLTDTKTVKKFMQLLETDGCTCNLDMVAGTAVAKVYKALQKGKGQPWLVCTKNSERIKWG